MNKKLLLEFIPLAIFLLFGLLKLFGISSGLPYGGLITVLSGFLLGMLYFYAAFWLFAETGTPVASRIIAGLAFSVTIIGCLFCLLQWPVWKIYGIISYIALGIMLIVCLFNFKSTAYKPLLYRCILFVVLLSLIYGYRSLPA